MATLPPGAQQTRVLREALAPYVSIHKLRRLASRDAAQVRRALVSEQPSPDVLTLLDLLAAILRPTGREHISSPADVAALLMVAMATLPQEQLRVVCLNTKNHVQTIHTVYQGSVNESCVRVAEVFREPLRRTSASIIVAHNHPSGDPSPEDVVVTRQLVQAGKLLDVAVLDHLIIGQGQWVSLRERRLGFEA